MKYYQGDIVLLPYPYTDLSEIKQRPAVIISKDSINKQNYIVAKITSVNKIKHRQIRQSMLYFFMPYNETTTKS